jgi:hypothetical protein
MKIMKPIFLMMLLTIFGRSLFAQVAMVSPYVISPCGGFYTMANGSYSTTAGELMVQTFHNGTWLTQGFQQVTPYITVGVNDMGYNSSEIKVYPNPANNQLSIFINPDKNRSYNLSVTDALGRRISSFTYTPSSIGTIYNLDISKLSSALYLLNVESSDKKFTKTIRFNKTNN